MDTVGRNKEKIAEYIRHRLDEDIMADQLSFREYIDPFTGSKNPKAEEKAAFAAARESTAVAGLFNAPLGAAGIIALKAWCIPPA